MKDIGHTDVKENDFKDTLLIIVISFETNGHAKVEENNSNNTPACDDNTHKAVLCTQSNFGSVQVLYKQVFQNPGPPPSPLNMQNKHGVIPPTPLKCLYNT